MAANLSVYFLSFLVVLPSNLRQETIVSNRFRDIVAPNIGNSNGILFYKELMLFLDFPNKPAISKSPLKPFNSIIVISSKLSQEVLFAFPSIFE
jgi:hypothetical protein